MQKTCSFPLIQSELQMSIQLRLFGRHEINDMSECVNMTSKRKYPHWGIVSAWSLTAQSVCVHVCVVCMQQVVFGCRTAQYFDCLYSLSSIFPQIWISLSTERSDIMYYIKNYAPRDPRMWGHECFDSVKREHSKNLWKQTDFITVFFKP